MTSLYKNMYQNNKLVIWLIFFAEPKVFPVALMYLKKFSNKNNLLHSSQMYLLKFIWFLLYENLFDERVHIFDTYLDYVQ